MIQGTVCPSRFGGWKCTDGPEVTYPLPADHPHEPVRFADDMPPFVAQWIAAQIFSSGVGGYINTRAEVHVCRNCGSLYMDAENRAKLGGS